ncbi:zinc transporter ZIP1 [Biomphalaria glabrata]|nr:zinc transporter ZIP1 [Biomphalaria glabrata]
MAMNIIGVKVFAGFIFFFLAMFFGWVPFWCLKRCVTNVQSERKRAPAMDYLHSLASGVLIAMSFLNLLPECLLSVREVLVSRRQDAVNHKGNSSTNSSDHPNDMTDIFPVAELLVAVGFIFIYITDTILKAWKHTKKVKKLADSDETVLFQVPKTSKYKNTKPNKFSKPKFSEEVEDYVSTANGGNNNSMSASGSDEVFHMEAESQNVSLMLSEENHPLAQKDKVDASETSKQVRSLALVTALAVHGFFDGVMLGLQTSERVILSLLFALSLHKTFVAVSMSLTLLHNYDKSIKSSRVFLYVFIFAVVAPAGLSLSAVFVHSAFDVSGKSADASVIPGCIQSFAVGTFIYVAFTETTKRDGNRSLNSEAYCHIFLSIGFILMAVLRVFLGSE